MVFSDTTNKDGIIQKIEFRTGIGDAGISGNSTLLKQITGQVNDYYMRATALILESDGRWKFDDAAHGDQPVSTTDLVEDQVDYSVLVAVPSAGQDWLEVERVNVKDASGKWYTLHHRDRRDFGTPHGERETVSGQPSSYDFDGTQIFLDYKPNYSSTNGLEVVFSRVPLEFSDTDTTKRPGFPTIFHEYLVLGPTYIWEKYKGVGNPEQTMRDIKEMEKSMGDFYNRRAQYEVNKLQRGNRKYR